MKRALSSLSPPPSVWAGWSARWRCSRSADTRQTQRVATEPSGLDRGGMAVPARTSGARARRSSARPPTAAPRSTSTSAPRSASAIARPASPTTRSSSGSRLRLDGQQIAKLGDGRPISVAWMKGRSRSYAIRERRCARASPRCRSPSTTAATRSSRRSWSDTTSGRDRARRDRVPQRQDRDALGRGHARACSGSNKTRRDATLRRIQSGRSIVAGCRRLDRARRGAAAHHVGADVAALEVAVGEAEARDRAAEADLAGVLST